MPIRNSVSARVTLFMSLLVLCIGAANAFPVTWTLSGVTFSDGGTATGSFVFDVDTNTISTWSVSVAGGNTVTFPPVTYDMATSSASYAYNAPTDVGALFNLNAPSIRALRLPAVSPLSDAGGTLAVNIAGSGAAECYNCGPFRTYTAGNLIGTAAPAISSASSVSYVAGTAVNFTVAATGAPQPTLSVAGALPSGVTFTDNGNGTGTFAGTATPVGVYPLTITASNGVSPDATQNFTLTVLAPQAVVRTPTLGGLGLLLCALLLLAAAWNPMARRAQIRRK
jgi:hypothetical protein